MAVVSMMRFAGDPDELFAKVRDHVDPVTRRLSPKHGGIANIVARTDDGILVDQPVGATRRAARRWPRSPRCSRRSARRRRCRGREIEAFEVLAHHLDDPAG